MIQDMGTVRAVSGTSPKRLEIACALGAGGDAVALGESIAVNGVCLTVVETGKGFFAAEAGAETLARTTAGSWTVGRRVNLERAMALGDRLGGHLVLGHVDGVGRATVSRAEQGGWALEVAAPPEIEPFLLPKGSVAVDGVSLTINRVDGDRFSVFLIPETIARTRLSQVRVGSAVNLEADILGKYVARLLGRAEVISPGGASPRAGALTIEALRAAGFVE